MPKLRLGTIVPTVEEDAAITAAAMQDLDCPPMTEDEWQQLPRVRGRPKLEAPKERLTMRVDADVLFAIKATGPGWQTRVNDFLRTGVARGQLVPR